MVHPKSSSVYGPSEARWVRKTLAKMTLEARAVGIHMAYFPVVDVNINPDNPIINTRSFGEIDIGGKLPVSIPECFPLGHGIQLPRLPDKK